MPYVFLMFRLARNDAIIPKISNRFRNNHDKTHLTIADAIAEETIADAIAEVKKEMRKPENTNAAKVEKPKAVKEAPQATIEPEPIQAPIEEEKAPEKASNEPLTAKDMQAFMIDLMKTGKITRPQLTDIMLEFGGASLMRIKPEKYELLKQRIETYND